MIGIGIRIGLSWLLLAAVYLALVGGVSLAEGAAAILCGGLGAVWVERIARSGRTHFALHGPALAPIPAALAGLPGETARIGLRLLSAVATGGIAGGDRAVAPGEAAACPLGGESPEVAARRAVSVLAASLSPDAYVLRLEPERGRILVHTLLPERAGESA